MEWSTVQNAPDDPSFNSIHVYPIHDDKEHVISENCHCTPTIEEYSNSHLVIHNAYDGRI